MQKQRLLLVEDSEDDAFLFTWTFEKAATAFYIHHVRNGFEAIEFLRHAQSPDSLPAIILLDLKMPVLNGFDVLHWMKKQSFPRPIPVIVVSGSAQEVDKAKARQLGAADYLVKPVTVADLHRILGHFPSGRKMPTLAESGARD